MGWIPDPARCDKCEIRIYDFLIFFGKGLLAIWPRRGVHVLGESRRTRNRLTASHTQSFDHVIAEHAAADLPSEVPPTVTTARLLPSDFYTPIDQVKEARSAQRTEELMREVVAFARPPRELLRRLSAQPLILWRGIASPNFETLRFMEMAASAGLPPLLLQTPNDRFMPAQNRTKAALAKLRIVVGRDRVGDRVINVRIVDFNQWDRSRFTEMRCLDGSAFVDFHLGLLVNALGRNVSSSIHDQTEFTRGEQPCLVYERLFALLTCFGALAESFLSVGSEASFTQKVVLPAFETVRARFGARAMIVKLLPEGEEAEDRWESYPAEVMIAAKRAAAR